MNRSRTDKGETWNSDVELRRGTAPGRELTFSLCGNSTSFTVNCCWVREKEYPGHIASLPLRMHTIHTHTLQTT